MIYVALAELAVILVLVLLYSRARDHEVQAMMDIMTANDLERTELLNRIQRPEWIPPGPQATPRPPTDEEREHAEALAKVGRVEL